MRTHGNTKQASACRIFALLAEDLINEVSSTMKMARKFPGGEELVRELHRRGLAHTVEYEETTGRSRPIAWGDLKREADGAWVLIVGDRGTGAIRAPAGASTYAKTYTVLTSTEGKVEQNQEDSGAKIDRLLKGRLGNLRRFFVARDTGEVARKHSQRKRLRKLSAAADPFSTENLMKKLRPIFVRGLDLAIADVKGHLSTQIKHDAYDKAWNQIGKIKRLIKYRDLLDASSTDLHSDITMAIRTLVNNAIYLAAARAYPDDVGEISRQSSGHLLSVVTVGDYTAIKKLMADLNSGQTAGLVDILHFFKDELVRA